MPSGCLEWSGQKDRGYGYFRYKGRKYPTHRYALELAGHTMTRQVLACHSCNNPPCCSTEPGHVYPGTTAQNTADAIRAGRHGIFALEASRWGKRTPHNRPDEVVQLALLLLARRAINARDIARALNISYFQARKIADRIPSRAKARHRERPT